MSPETGNRPGRGWQRGQLSRNLESRKPRRAWPQQVRPADPQDDNRDEQRGGQDSHRAGAAVTRAAGRALTRSRGAGRPGPRIPVRKTRPARRAPAGGS
jgi:hypothetical protein